jgi:two-component system, NarL family, sensor kinase
MQEDFQVIFIVVIGTLLLILLVAFIVMSVYFYQRSQHKHLNAMEDLKNTVQKEILIAQLEIKEKTLNTIAQEIHDNIGQVLSLAKLNLNKVLVTDTTADSEKLNSTKDLIGKAIQDLRNLSKTLNTEYIGDHNLSQLLQTDINLIDKMGDYKINLKIEGVERLHTPQNQLIIYRITQEALNNIIKHAKGNQIDIILNYLPDSFHLTIKDNGVGFQTSSRISEGKRGNGSGIYNMQNRARLIGGVLSYESNPGAGTILKLILPFNSTT